MASAHKSTEKPNSTTPPATEPPSSLNEAPAPQTEATLVRKVSVKSVMEWGSRPDEIPKVGEEIKLYRVFGVSHAVKTGTGDNGPFCAFLGSFEAVRYKDGKRFQGGQCFVPRAVEDLLVASMRSGQKNDSTASVEFAIEVGIKGTDKSVPWEYTVKNLVNTE